MSDLKLSIVIPAYNEAANLKNGVLDEVYNYLKNQKYSYEVLIVDDASKDDTRELVEKIIKNKSSFRLIKNEHGGKAITVMAGMLAAKGEIVLFTDMDQATPLKEIEKLMPKFDEFDVVIGSRGAVRPGAPLVRRISALGFILLRTIIVGLPVKDTQCGFKAFTNDAVQKIFPPMLVEWKKHQEKGAAVNAGFDIEFLFIARKKGLKIAEVPVEWHHVGTERVQLISDAIEAVKDMLRIRLNDLSGKYN
jgi:dolichyl-phosphate beta-glucosyltransferase